MFREKKRRVKLPLRAYLMYITLLSFLFTGVTFSKYVTRSSGGDSARVVKFGNLRIDETIPQYGWVIVPGVDIIKNATVDVTASEVDTYIFLKVDASGFSLKADGQNRNFTTTMDQIQWSVHTNWTFLKQDGNSYIYYKYLDTNTPFVQNIITDDCIHVSNTITEAQLANIYNAISIDFKAYMVQGGGFENVQTAWDSIKGK